jgi:hypothetical protein
VPAMKRALANLTALFVMLSLGACISTSQMRETVPAGASIAVVTPAKNPRFILTNYADAKGFIPFYGFAKALEGSAAQTTVNRELDAQGFDIAEELQRILVADLRSRGVAAMPFAIDRPAEAIPAPLKTSEIPLAGGAWAVLDTQITGYGLNAAISGEFRPFIGVRARLIHTQSKAVIYDQRFAYNAWGGKVIKIPFEPADQWRDIDAVKSDLARVRAALITGLSKATALIATDVASK